MTGKPVALCGPRGFESRPRRLRNNSTTYINYSDQVTCRLVRIITFTGLLAGLNAASLHSEYYEEYTLLSKHVDNIIVVTDSVKSREKLDVPKMKIFKLPAIRIPKIYGLTKILFYCLAVIKEKKRYDIIYVRTFSPPELTALWIGKRLLGAKSIIVLPGTWLFGSPEERVGIKTKIFRWILRRALYAADRVVLYSWLMLPEVSYYAPKLTNMKGKIVIIRNAVNINRFRPGALLPDKYRKLIGSSCYIIYVGRINEKKGVGDIVGSISKDILGDAKLVLIGKGESNYLEALKLEIQKRGIDENVVLLGEVPNKDLPGLMANARFMVYATRGGEGIPRAILECMACGRPAIATRVAGIPDAVRHLETGILIDPADRESLGRWIKQLLSDPQLVDSLGQTARKLIEEEFSYDVVIPKLLMQFHSLTNQSS